MLYVAACGSDSDLSITQGEGTHTTQLEETDKPTDVKVDRINVETDSGATSYNTYMFAPENLFNPSEKFYLDNLNNIIIVCFDYTNNAQEAQMMSNSFWVRVYQDGVECDRLSTYTSNVIEALDNSSKKVMTNGESLVGWGFLLNNTTSPITIEVTDNRPGITTREYQTMEIEIEVMSVTVDLAVEDLAVELINKNWVSSVGDTPSGEGYIVFYEDGKAEFYKDDGNIQSLHWTVTDDNAIKAYVDGYEDGRGYYMRIERDGNGEIAYLYTPSSKGDILLKYLPTNI